MRTYKLTISYDGTRYQGWQRQATTDNTIQFAIEYSIGKLVGYRVRVDGSGRTDSGVHAREQVASVKLSKLYDVQELKERGLQVSCINLSCGYYEPHTDHEFTIKKDLMSCLSLVEHIIENCTDTYPHQTEILDGRWRSYDEFDEAVDEIFALLDQGELWSIEDLYYMYHSVFPKLDMEDYQRIYTEYYNLNKIEYGKQKL